MLRRKGKKYVTDRYKINAEEVPVFPKKAENSSIKAASAEPTPATLGRTPVIRSITADKICVSVKLSPEKPKTFIHMKVTA